MSGQRPMLPWRPPLRRCILCTRQTLASVVSAAPAATASARCTCTPLLLAEQCLRIRSSRGHLYIEETSERASLDCMQPWGAACRLFACKADWVFANSVEFLQAATKLSTLIPLQLLASGCKPLIGSASCRSADACRTSLGSSRPLEASLALTWSAGGVGTGVEVGTAVPLAAHRAATAADDRAHLLAGGAHSC